MQYNKTYLDNKKKLKICNYVYNFFSFIYMFICIPCTFIGIYFILITVSNDELSYFFDFFLLKAVFLAFAVYGLYKKNNLYCFLSTSIMILNIIFFQSYVNNILLPLSVLGTALAVLSNKQYHILEQEDGFPYFNERVDKQNEDFRGGTDVYQERYEEIVKNSSNQMDDI